MTALVASIRPRWRAVVDAAAEPAGLAARRAVRFGVTAVRSLPGLAGAGLVSYGFYQAWAPLGFIVAGGFVLAERWMP